MIKIIKISKKIIKHIIDLSGKNNKANKLRLDRYFCILNINLDLTVNQRKALLVYVPTIFHATESANRIIHTNVLESAQIVKELIKRNFCIDVFDCNKSSKLLKEILNDRKYDLIIGLGEAFATACEMYPNAASIIYITENNPAISSINERVRIDRYNKKNNKSAKLERTNIYFKSGTITRHNAAIVLGDLDSFCNEPIKKYSLCPTGFLNQEYPKLLNRLERSNRSFIWMGTNAPIHKGLDVLIEAFSDMKEYDLHIIGMSSEQLKKYGIIASQNIKIHGFLNIASKEFADLVKICSFIILPSCSEAMSTSVLTGMRHGLIPMVLPDIGMNGIPYDLRITLRGYMPNELKIDIKNASNIETNILRELSRKVYNYANDVYTIERFAKDLSLIFDDIEYNKYFKN